jgi:hypothetical protein
MLFDDLPTLPTPIADAARLPCAYRGAREPCSFFASRRCPKCALALCNGHTRTVTEMGRTRDPQAGLRRCSGCGFAGDDAAYNALA